MTHSIAGHPSDKSWNQRQADGLQRNGRGDAGDGEALGTLRICAQWLFLRSSGSTLRVFSSLISVNRRCCTLSRRGVRFAKRSRRRN